MTPSDCFTQANGEKISYIDYYKTHYNLKIEDSNQPLLIHNVSVSGSNLSRRLEHLNCPNHITIRRISDILQLNFTLS